MRLSFIYSSKDRNQAQSDRGNLPDFKLLFDHCGLELLALRHRVLVKKLIVAQLDDKILRRLQFPKIHYRVNKSQPMQPVQRQFNPVHTFISHSFTIYLKMILPTPRKSNWSLPLYFSNQSLIVIFVHTGCHTFHPSHFYRNLDAVLDTPCFGLALFFNFNRKSFMPELSSLFEIKREKRIIVQDKHERTRKETITAQFGVRSRPSAVGNDETTQCC